MSDPIEGFVKADLEALSRGARLERMLRTLLPGFCIRITAATLADVMVPADPLDHQTVKYLAEWFRVRMPFNCSTREIIDSGDWEFKHEKEVPEEMRRGEYLPR